MAVVFVKEQGAYLRKKSRRVIVEKNSEKIKEIQMQKLNGVVLYGNVQVSTQLMKEFFDRGIDITYMSKKGRYLGSAKSYLSKNIFIKLSQYDKYNNEEFKVKFMKAIISAKSYNQKSLIKIYNWRNSKNDFEQNILNIEKIIAGLETKNDRKGIMGIEGAISAEYFKAFRKILKTELEFEKRTRRPAKDPVNALLNLGYTFLTNEISSLLESMSFETCLGFLHGVQYGRKSLALDMVEEFRQPVIDKFILNVLNKKVFKKVDFEETDKGFILSEDAFGKFCIEYQRYITKRDKDGMNFEEVFKNQIKLLKESIMKNKLYKPYRMEI